MITRETVYEPIRASLPRTLGLLLTITPHPSVSICATWLAGLSYLEMALADKVGP